MVGEEVAIAVLDRLALIGTEESQVTACAASHGCEFRCNLKGYVISAVAPPTA